MSDGFPRLRFVGDAGILVEFGDAVDERINDRVINLDAALAADPFVGMTAAIPSYASLLIAYDPCVADLENASAKIRYLLDTPAPPFLASTTHEVPVCYDEDLAPDLVAVAEQTGLRPEKVIEAHQSATYRVYMQGFAPGFAYLGGVPRSIQLPRKSNPVRGVAAGNVIIAGPQCIVTTVEMPSGWWIIGRSPLPIFRPNDAEPFLFKVGDHVRFVAIRRGQFQLLSEQARVS